MTVELRIILIVVSFFTAALMLRRIRRSKVRIEDSVFWIVLSFIILIFSIFPQVVDACANALHIYLTTNFLFLFFILIPRYPILHIYFPLMEPSSSKIASPNVHAAVSAAATAPGS